MIVFMSNVRISSKRVVIRYEDTYLRTRLRGESLSPKSNTKSENFLNAAIFKINFLHDKILFFDRFFLLRLGLSQLLPKNTILSLYFRTLSRISKKPLTTPSPQPGSQICIFIFFLSPQIFIIKTIVNPQRELYQNPEDSATFVKK